MGRNIIYILLIVLLNSNCNNSENNKEGSVFNIYFTNKYTACLHLKQYANLSSLTKLTVYDQNCRELFSEENEVFSQTGFDFVKGDTIFLHKRKFSSPGKTDTNYYNISSGRFIVFCRNIYLFGSAGGESQKKIYMGRDENNVFFKAYMGIKSDTIHLKNLDVSKEKITVIKYLRQEGGIVCYREKINFIDVEGQRKLIEDLNLNF